METEVYKALHVISPEIQQITFVTDRVASQRIPKAKISNMDKPIFLASLGEGVNRLFGLAVALVNCRDGLFLIDEIETGLHYSIQDDLWKLVFKMAQTLNIQVFATTHSWDCIKGFQKATESANEEEAYLVRFINKKGQIKADLFDKETIKIAVSEDIEFR